MNYIPTKEEQQEYLAYHSQKDFFKNLEDGIRAVKDFNFIKMNKKVVLIAGAMVAFDKGTINFLNQMSAYNQKSQFILLSEVTAENRRKTEDNIRFEYLCTPHLLAKEILVPYLNILASKEIANYLSRKKYILQAVDNLNKRHKEIGEGYAEALMYYADRYIRVLLDKIKPDMVILWNEFYAFHMIFQQVCKIKKIKIGYMEFGCIPGTFALEKHGQQGESFPACHPICFNSLGITKQEIRAAVKGKKYIFKTCLNRNWQPLFGKMDEIFLLKKKGQPVITYMGQNDYESGMYPYTIRTKRYHSPVFQTTLEGLEFIELLAIKNNWTLLYKPHPIMEALGHEAENGKRYLNLTSINIHEVIDYSDIVITILSQSAYISLLRNKPVVLLGYMQLKKSGCVYEAYHKKLIEKKLKEALKYGYTDKQKKCFLKHMTRLLKYYLIDDQMHPEIPFGRKLNEALLCK